MERCNIRYLRLIPVLLAIVYFIYPSKKVFADRHSKVTVEKEIVTVQFPLGESPYIVATSKTELQKHIIERLAVYLGKVLHKSTIIVSDIKEVPATSPAIILAIGNQKLLPGIKVPQSSPEAFILETLTTNSHAVVIAIGNTELGLKRAVQRLVLKSEQRTPGLVIPELHLSESPWIARREWAIVPWIPEQVRGTFYNSNGDKRQNIWLYSDQQTADYVEMFDWFGFNGCQLLETPVGYEALGSPEAFQDRELRFARFNRENGQNVSLWVWAAQFNDYGWSDPEVTYTPAKGQTAFTDSKVRTAFEKYYNSYARMAPYVDLLIAHFYDPGSLTNREDVFNYLHLLKDKFKAKNPNIKLGVDFWAAGSYSEYMQQLIKNGFGDALLLEMSMPNVYAAGKRESLHEEAAKQNLKLGMWGWYMTEYESDQLPSMYVNAKLLKNFYQTIKNGVQKIYPLTYWSEMEASHLDDIFSMYAAGQLLWNPDRNPDEILKEIADGIWGPRNGPLILEVLKLIQDVRSGATWNTFWWRSPEYRLGTDRPADDLRRAEKALARLENMRTDSSYVPKFPLPFPPATFVELMIPHLMQIKFFAEFRVKIAAIREAAKKGTSKVDLTKLANEAWQPIPEYSTWIGTFGQPEAKMQGELMEKLGKDLSIEVKPPAWVLYRDTNRFLQGLQDVQRNHFDQVKFRAENSGATFQWSVEKVNECVNMLIRDGALSKLENGKYSLSNWEEYRMR